MKITKISVVALVLVVIACAISYYKHSVLGLPFFPSEEAEVWIVEAKLQFNASGGPAKVNFYIPNSPPGFTRFNEDFISSNYGLHIEQSAVNRQALWAVRRARDQQILYYRMEFTADSNDRDDRRLSPMPAFPQIPAYEEPMGSAINAVLKDVRSHSADIVSYTRELLTRLNKEDPDQNITLINKAGRGSEAWVRQIINVLAGARIPARIVYVLPLKDLVKHGTLEPWLEVHNGTEWIAFEPTTGRQGFNQQTLVWYTGDDTLATVIGGRLSEVVFSMSKHAISQVVIAEQRALNAESRLMDFSLFALPVQTQNVYRIILLVPLGALVIVVLRNLVGLSTFGTFMPVLIALAFRETELIWGIFLFTFLVIVGLVLRLYLERLKLLLVPRLTAVLTIVVMLIACFSVISVQLEMERGLSVALFPMVIIAMTIERMSIVVEENGSKDALKLGLGSLVAAIASYLVMTNQWLTHLIFVFPETLLIVLAITLLLGRYTGYRLMELWRFRSFMKDADPL